MRAIQRRSAQPGDRQEASRQVGSLKPRADHHGTHQVGVLQFCAAEISLSQVAVG
jgi:hypothetical protein